MVYQHTADIATIDMGARQYVPLLGRFLSVDPIASGNTTAYNYPNDPIDGNDVSGQMLVMENGPEGAEEEIGEGATSEGVDNIRAEEVQNEENEIRGVRPPVFWSIPFVSGFDNESGNGVDRGCC